VLTPEDYDRALGIYEDWAAGRTDADVSRDRRGQLQAGTLRLNTNSSIGSGSELRMVSKSTLLEWVEFEGNACVPELPDKIPLVGR
jgi:hypothetical protein